MKNIYLVCTIISKIKEGEKGQRWTVLRTAHAWCLALTQPVSLTFSVRHTVVSNVVP